MTQAVAYDDAKAGIADAVQSFGDFQNFHPHLHVLATDGCFHNDAGFVVCPPPESFILYDESSLPNVDDYLIDANYPMETSLKKFSLTPGKIKTKLYLAHVLHMCYFMLERYISI